MLERAERRVGLRRLDDAGERRRFGQREVDDVLAEEEPRAFGHAVDRERAALSEIDLVQIQLEDLVLGQPLLDDERHELLGELAAHRLLGRQQQVLDQLLRQRAAADEIGLVAAEVGDDRAERIESDRRRDGRRSGGPRSRAPPGARACGICASGTLRRFSRASGMSAVRSGGSSVTDRSAPSSASCSMRLIVDVAGEFGLAAAGPNTTRTASPSDLPPRIISATAFWPTANSPGSLDLRHLRVAEVVQPIDQLPVGQRLSRSELERPGEDAGKRPRPLAVQPGVDDARQGDVVVGHHPEQDAGRPGEPHGDVPQPPPTPAARRRSGLRRGRGRCADEGELSDGSHGEPMTAYRLG